MSNQVLATKLWHIDCEKSIGVGLRNGFAIFIFFSVFSILVRMSLGVTSAYSWFLLSVTEAVVITLAFVMICVPPLGYVGAKIVERSYQCPHCMVRHYYAPRKDEGVVTCQNCGKQFSVNK